MFNPAPTNFTHIKIKWNFLVHHRSHMVYEKFRNFFLIPENSLKTLKIPQNGRLGSYGILENIKLFTTFILQTLKAKIKNRIYRISLVY